MKESLDIYDDMPKPMKIYISHFGWHFNKAACLDAVKKLYRYDPNGKRIKIETKGKEQVEEILKKNNVELKENTLYDAVYLYNWIVAVLVGVSVDDEKHAVATMKAIIDYPGLPGGNIFRHWYMDMISMGEGVDFDDYLDD